MIFTPPWSQSGIPSHQCYSGALLATLNRDWLMTMATVSPGAKAALLLALTMLCYASITSSAARYVQLPPLGLSFWRWLCGAAILLPFIAPNLRQLLPALPATLAYPGAARRTSDRQQHHAKSGGLQLCTSAANTSLIASQPTIYRPAVLDLPARTAVPSGSGAALAWRSRASQSSSPAVTSAPCATCVQRRRSAGAAGPYWASPPMGSTFGKYPPSFPSPSRCLPSSSWARCCSMPFYIAESLTYMTMPVTARAGMIVVALACWCR